MIIAARQPASHFLPMSEDGTSPDVKAVAAQCNDTAWTGDAEQARSTGATLAALIAGYDSMEPATQECRIIVYTDVVESTKMIQRLGDVAGVALLDRHDRMVRLCALTYGGLEVRTTGDGFVVAFRSVCRALSFALALRTAFRTHNLLHPDATILIRTGVHAGEPVLVQHELQGTVLHMAARVMALAGPEQIFVSDVVRQLAEGKDFNFAEYGDVEVKGFSRPVLIHELMAPPNRPAKALTPGSFLFQYGEEPSRSRLRGDLGAVERKCFADVLQCSADVLA